jgi:hypothetical protein
MLMIGAFDITGLVHSSEERADFNLQLFQTKPSALYASAERRRR